MTGSGILNNGAKIALQACTVVGLGGYGLTHIRALNWLEEKRIARLRAVVALPHDRQQEPELTASLEERGVLLFDDLDSYFARGLQPGEILMLPIGIHQHVPVSVQALRAGLHVYCEKPAAATVQEIDSLAAVADKLPQQLAIGFQHLCSSSMQKLKKRILDGRCGAIRQLRLVCSWARSERYYQRNRWAGKLRLGDHWILDSPANNAVSHYLMNALFLAGSRQLEAAPPATLQAEMYRANAIESADTTQLRLTTATGADMFISFTHANGFHNGPFMEIECEKARCYWLQDSGETSIFYKDGTIEHFNNRDQENWRWQAIRDFVEAVRDGRPPVCSLAMARNQTLAINLMHESAPIHTVAAEHIKSEVAAEQYPVGSRSTFHRVRNMDTLQHLALRQGQFFSEMRVPWAAESPGNVVEARGYSAFTGKKV